MPHGQLSMMLETIRNVLSVATINDLLFLKAPNLIAAINLKHLYKQLRNYTIQNNLNSNKSDDDIMEARAVQP